MIRLIHYLLYVALGVVLLLLQLLVKEALGSSPHDAASWTQSGPPVIASAMRSAASDDFARGESEMRGYGPRRHRGRILFRYRDDDYEQVYLSGDFNGWVREPMTLDEIDEVWSIEVDLEQGHYDYQFLIRDGELWDAIDPDNPEAKRDPDRGWVSRIRVDEDGWVEARERRRRHHHTVSVEVGGSFRSSDEDCDEDFGLQYQRVDGLMLSYFPTFESHGRFEPWLEGQVGYGFKSKDWSLGLSLFQPLVPDHRLVLKISGYARTDFTDQTGIGTLENTAAAVFFKEDFRDYYRREGISLSLLYGNDDWLRVEGGFASNDESSLERRANWSWGGGRWLDNPAIDDGTVRTLFARARLGDEDNHLEVDYARSGPDILDGDFEFEQLTGQLRSRFELGSRQHLDARLRGGSNFRGSLPQQRRYVLGGLGTVRGYGYRSLLMLDAGVMRDPADPVPLGGERFFFVNAEYSFRLDDDFDMIVFFDSGMAYESRDADIDPDDFKSSAGLGFQLDDGGLRLNVIKTLDGADRDPIVQLRLNRMF